MDSGGLSSFLSPGEPSRSCWLSELPGTEACPHEDQGRSEPGVAQLYMTAALATQGTLSPHSSHQLGKEIMKQSEGKEATQGHAMWGRKIRY